MTAAGAVTVPPGRLFVISGPSGVGKTVLCARMMERFAPNMVFSISVTTRPPRGGELPGREYWFWSTDAFERAIAAGELAEWAQVHGHYYGTPKAFLMEHRAAGRHVLLNIDVQGGMKIRAAFPDTVLIFLAPPSFAVLEERLRRRNIDAEETVLRRLANARVEMSFQKEYTHTVINDTLEDAARELEELIRMHIQSGS